MSVKLSRQQPALPTISDFAASGVIALAEPRANACGDKADDEDAWDSDSKSRMPAVEAYQHGWQQSRL
jgi:hypothetical protein